MPVVQIGLLHTGNQGVFQGLVGQTINAANVWLAQNAPGTSVQLQAIRAKYANDDLEQLEDDALALVADPITEIILAAGGPQSAVVARDATEDANSDVAKRKPVVFTTVTDPVGLGLRNQLPAPGGTNLVGMAGQTSELDPRRLRILHAFVTAQGPNVGNKVGVLVNPLRERNHEQYEELKLEAQARALDLKKRLAINVHGIRNAYRFFQRKQVLGVVVTADSFFNNNRATIIQAAANRRVPTIYQWKVFVEGGGLISCGPSIDEAYQKAGKHVGMLARELPQNRLPSNIDCSSPDVVEVWVKRTTANDLNYTVFPNVLDHLQVNYMP
jgi:putative tryptophan/tyrosine transport system substrate-binding protein